MEYHQDRFEDFSLMIFKKEKIIALLPLNLKDHEVFSHQGLSYGGLVFTKTIKFKDSLEVFKCVLLFLYSEGIKRLHLKALPKIYHQYPADEIEYLLFLVSATLTRTDVSSTIDLRIPNEIQSNRIEGVKKAKKAGLIIKEEANFKNFWNEILVPNLKVTHNVEPVHTLFEIELLAKRFPKKIIQFNVYNGDKIIGGATIFKTSHLAHVQYISASSKKQQFGTLDFLFHRLITERFANCHYFDFGNSNKNDGQSLNEGLQYWKESFGARSTVQQFYTIDTSNYSKLENVFL